MEATYLANAQSFNALTIQSKRPGQDASRSIVKSVTSLDWANHKHSEYKHITCIKTNFLCEVCNWLIH